MSNSLRPHGLYSSWNSPGQNTGVGSLSLLQGIFPTQGSNPGLLHCRWILYQLSHKGTPRILKWVAYPFSRGSSWPRNWTGVSCTAGRFFTNWAIREATDSLLERAGRNSQCNTLLPCKIWLKILPGKSHGRRSLVGCSPWGCKESDRTERLPFTFHFHALEKEMATHSSGLAWRIPGTGEPGGLPSIGSHRVRHDWSNLAAAAAG